MLACSLSTSWSLLNWRRIRIFCYQTKNLPEQNNSVSVMLPDAACWTKSRVSWRPASARACAAAPWQGCWRVETEQQHAALCGPMLCHCDSPTARPLNSSQNKSCLLQVALVGAFYHRHKKMTPEELGNVSDLVREVVDASP